MKAKKKSVNKKPTSQKSSSKGFSVAIVGATGLVDGNTISILEERNFPVSELHLLASKRSLAESIEFHNKAYDIQDIEEFDFGRAQICFFCTSTEVSSKFVPMGVEY